MSFLVGWTFILSQNLRYMLPALPPLAILLAASIHYCSYLRLGTLLNAGVVGAIYLAAIGNALNAFDLYAVSGRLLPYQLLTGSMTRDEYRSSYVRAYWALEYLNTHYGANAKLWAPFFSHRLYSQSPVYMNDPFLTEPLRQRLHNVEISTDPEFVSTELSALGFTHLLINGWRPETSLPENERPAYLRSEFLDVFTHLEYADNGMVLYRLLLTPRVPHTMPATELLPNPSFEAGDDGRPEGWFATLAASSWDGTELAARTGVGALRLEAENDYYSDFLPAIPGLTYRLRVYSRSLDPSTVGRFGIQFFTADMRHIPRPWVGYYPGAEYRPFELLSTAPPAARYIRVQLGVLPAGHVLLVDYVSLTHVAQ
jgi:hypothetical protein